MYWLPFGWKQSKYTAFGNVLTTVSLAILMGTEVADFSTWILQSQTSLSTLFRKYLRCNIFAFTKCDRRTFGHEYYGNAYITGAPNTMNWLLCAYSMSYVLCMCVREISVIQWRCFVVIPNDHDAIPMLCACGKMIHCARQNQTGQSIIVLCYLAGTKTRNA